MTACRSLLPYLACAAVLCSVACAQQSPSTPADSNDARKLLELNQAAAQAKQWAEEARDSVAAADHALKWLRPLLNEHQQAAQSVTAAKLLEVTQWVYKWEEDVSEWVWWFDADWFRKSEDRIWDVTRREAWSIRTEAQIQAAANQSNRNSDWNEEEQSIVHFDWVKEAGDARRQLLSDLQSLQQRLCAEDRSGTQYRPWLEICGVTATPVAVQWTLRSTTEWIEAEEKAAELRASQRSTEQGASENARIKADAEKALAQSKEMTPKLKQRAAETAEWAKEAREGDDYAKIRVADDASRMAAAELDRCEKDKQRASATIAECAADAKEHEAQLKQLAVAITAAEAHIKTSHAAAAQAWSQMTAAVAATNQKLEEQSKKGHDDAALLDQAAARWLQEAKDLARAKGR